MQRPSVLYPVLITLAGVGLYSVMDAMMKGASLAVGAYSALLWRSILAAGVMFPLWRLRGGRWPAPATLRLHVLRGVVATGMAFSFFWALTRLPIAEAIAISFVSPLIALFLASALLGETIRRGAVAASLIGLVGVAVIGGGRIGAAEASLDAALGVAAVLASAALYAWNLILQRRQSLIAGPTEVTTFMNGTMVLTLLPFAPFLATPPDTTTTSAIIGGAAFLTVAAGMCLSWAYGRAEAQVLVPLEYSAFAWAALVGWLAFDEALTLPTLAGTVLVVAACWIAVPRRRPEPSAL